MINLIPNQEKKRMARDFYLKLVAVFYMMLGSSIFIAATAMIPPYFLSSVNKSAANDRLQFQQNLPTPVVGEDTLKEVKAIDAKLLMIEGLQGVQFVVSKRVIDQILSHKSVNISITSISYESTESEGRLITVGGVASSRESLLAFQKSLQKDKSFEEVNLPISNFVKDTDIEYSFKIKPKE